MSDANVPAADEDPTPKGAAEAIQELVEEVVVAETNAVSEIAATEPADPDAELVAEGDAAADYLEALLDIIDRDGDIDIDVENGRASVAVVEVNEGELDDLVGPGGKVLDALQDLTRLAASQDRGHRSRLMLDVAGFRAQRRKELQRIASAAVAEAQSAQGPVRLDPMNAFERKVVHDVIADAGLRSESEGTDPNRYVVITTV